MISHACTCAPAGRRGLTRGTGEPGAMFSQTSDLEGKGKGKGKHHDATKMFCFVFFSNLAPVYPYVHVAFRRQ